MAPHHVAVSDAGLLPGDGRESMRIAHVSDCYLPRLGGIELQVHDLAERQAAAGHEVTVITTTAGPDPGLRAGGSIVVRVGGTGPDTDAICYRYAGRGRYAALD